MTVTYNQEVADNKAFGCFWKLLFRWKGSIYKIIWPDLLVYTIFYFTLSFIYRFALNDAGKLAFEKAALYCEHFSNLIPLSFVLGFYVSIVVQRWWAQWDCLPWPDTLAMFVATSITGHDDRGRLMRRTIMRYVNLSFVLTFAMISPCVKKRFPTTKHLVDSGLMTENEMNIYECLQKKTAHSIYWMPLAWAGALVTRARKEMRIKDDFAVKTIIDEITRVRGLCGSVLGYDWVNIPLVYTQVVTLAVYTFFVSTLMGSQFLDPARGYENKSMDIYIPIFTYLQFFFYMGWLKVAESLVNPFGEDDNDFEINFLVDRNLQVSYLIVDEMHQEHPELIQDKYWEEVVPQDLPYTVAAKEFKPADIPRGSTAKIEVAEKDMKVVNDPVETPCTNDKSTTVSSEIPLSKLKAGTKAAHVIKKMKPENKPGPPDAETGELEPLQLEV